MGDLGKLLLTLPLLEETGSLSLEFMGACDEETLNIEPSRPRHGRACCRDVRTYHEHGGIWAKTRWGFVILGSGSVAKFLA